MSEFEQPEFTSPPAAPPRMPIQRRRTSGKAVFAFFFGILSLGTWIFAGLPAFILALQAKSDMRQDSNLYGRGLANLGLAAAFVSFFTVPIFLFMAFALSGTMNFGSMAQIDDVDRIVHLHLSGGLSESPSTDPYAAFGPPSMTLTALLDSIESAQYNDSVLAIVITLDMFQPSFTQIEELQLALAAFQEEGKKLYVHSEEATMSTGIYALCSGATQLNAVPTAMINLVGMYSESIYLKDGLEKIGVTADIVHIGDYKSAGEMMMLSGPSEAAEEGTNWMLDGLYDSLVDGIARGRKLTPDEVRSFIDDGPYSAEQAEALGVIDSRLYMDELVALLKEEYGEDIYFDNDYVAMFDFTTSESSFSFLSPVEPDDAIGLVYIEGTIVPGYGQGAAFSGSIRTALDAAAKDDSIAAVVVRVDSPGGSVTASEVILRAIDELNTNKPVVISMGGVAASGGYYVACKADAIFANESTITGSIGVVGGKIITTGLWDELGINWYPYKRGANADWTSGAEPFNEHQRAQIVTSMGEAYTVFKDHVTAGREGKLTKELEEMAGGHVFTGKQALELGLVDEIGGLNDAIDYAAGLVELDTYEVRIIPEPMAFSEMLMQQLFGSGDNRPTDMSLDPFSKVSPIEYLQSSTQHSVDDAIRSAIYDRFDSPRARAMHQLVQSADLIHKQGVVALMPELIVMH